MHASVMQWATTVLTNEVMPEDVTSVLEVGSQNINGSLRPWIIHRYQPPVYIGTDMQAGPGVDVVMTAEDLDQYFKPTFDLIICTEMLEHAKLWRSSLVSMVNCLADDGFLLLTTRSPGFPLHGYPQDYWRFTVGMMAHIMDALKLVGMCAADPDPKSPGVCILASKSLNTRRDTRVLAPLLHLSAERVT